MSKLCFISISFSPKRQSLIQNYKVTWGKKEHFVITQILGLISETETIFKSLELVKMNDSFTKESK